jgi:hypothetical protein
VREQGWKPSEEDIRRHFAQHNVQTGRQVNLEHGLARQLNDRYMRALLCLARHGLTYTQTLIESEYAPRYTNRNTARAAAYRDLHWLKWNGYVQVDVKSPSDPYREHWDRRQEVIRLSQLGELYLGIDGIKPPRYDESLLRYQSVGQKLGLLPYLYTGGAQSITYQDWRGRAQSLLPPAMTNKYILVLDQHHIPVEELDPVLEQYIGYSGLQTILITHRQAQLKRHWLQSASKAWEGLSHRPIWLMPAKTVNWSKVIAADGANIRASGIEKG